MSDDELPEESHRLARKWLDMIGADIVAHGDSLVTYHALSILFVSLVGQWVRAQPCVTKVEVILQHVAALTVEGIEVGIELWNGDHPGERIEVSPKPSYSLDEITEFRRRQRTLPRRRPPRSRPC